MQYFSAEPRPRWGESRANPNRPTWQQRQTRVAAFLGAEPAVSGSDTRGLDGQDPAESRGFLGLCPSARGKSLHLQTEWRWNQSGANSSQRSVP